MVHDTVWGKISTLNEIYRRRLKPKSTPNFSNLGPVNLRDRPMLATKLVLLVFFWRMFALILLHDVRESLPKWSLNWVTIVFGCQDDHQHREYLPVSEVVLLALHVARRSFMPYSHMGPSVEQFFGIKLYHTVWWQYVVFKALNHFEYTWLHLFFRLCCPWLNSWNYSTHTQRYVHESSTLLAYFQELWVFNRRLLLCHQECRSQGRSNCIWDQRPCQTPNNLINMIPWHDSKRWRHHKSPDIICYDETV